MAAIDWPATLPTSVLVSSFQTQSQDALVRTDVDSGPAKVRRRFTSVVDYMRIELLLTSAEFATLETFWKTTLAHGSEKFNFPHPITGVDQEVRLAGPPATKARSGVVFAVSMVLEVFGDA